MRWRKEGLTGLYHNQYEHRKNEINLHLLSRKIETIGFHDLHTIRITEGAAISLVLQTNATGKLNESCIRNLSFQGYANLAHGNKPGALKDLSEDVMFVLCAVGCQVRTDPASCAVVHYAALCKYGIRTIVPGAFRGEDSPLSVDLL